MYAREGNHKGAAEVFRGVLIHEPNNWEALLRLGISLFEDGDAFQALYYFRRCKAEKPRDPLGLMHHGLCLAQIGTHVENAGDTAEGLADLRRAAARMDGLPDHSKAILLNNLGNTLERLNLHAEALPVLEKGIAFDPLDPFPHYNRGIALMRLWRYREAIDAFNACLSLQRRVGESRANDADAYYNRGIGYLLLGEMARGFADYEARLLTTETDPPNLGLPVDLKLKPGDDIAGSIILVHCEQGLGDSIQFMRFVPELVRRGARVRLIVHRQLMHLVSMENVEVLPVGTKLADDAGAYQFDRWVAIMSLPWVLGITGDAQIPAPWWFPVYTDAVESWKSRIGRAQFTVAVCWAGNFRHKNDEHRSIALGTFRNLFQVPGVRFVAVQQARQNEAEELQTILRSNPNVQHFELDDFRDTAAVMCACDLTITVDTSVAHIAGSLGRPTWTLIPKTATDWRWQLERTDSPWYPSISLYRQSKVGDWRSVMDRVTRDLTAMAAQRAAANAA